jgi:antitoxin component of RelBE/YafQ-DinJ toxin-antitoxin module
MRIRANLKIDEETMTAMKELAAESGMAMNKYIELVLFRSAQGSGKIPMQRKAPEDGRGGWQGGVKS